MLKLKTKCKIVNLKPELVHNKVLNVYCYSVCFAFWQCCCRTKPSVAFPWLRYIHTSFKNTTTVVTKKNLRKNFATISIWTVPARRWQDLMKYCNAFSVTSLSLAARNAHLRITAGMWPLSLCTFSTCLQQCNPNRLKIIYTTFNNAATHLRKPILNTPFMD